MDVVDEDNGEEGRGEDAEVSARGEDGGDRGGDDGMSVAPSTSLGEPEKWSWCRRFVAEFQIRALNKTFRRTRAGRNPIKFNVYS